MGNGQSQRKREEEESSEGASTSSFISPEAAGVGSREYDVFLSFRGSDTRKAFTNHLYHSLVKAGTVPLCVFRDDNSIPIGEEFGSQILDAIAQSKISIPVISENYASSKWCLRELTRIMDCKKSTSHIVLPIFYKVAPSDVRHLTGNFGKAFHSSKERFDENDIREGQRALNEVSYLNGWESEKIADGHEGELIQHVVKTVISKLQKDFPLNVPKQLVGLDGRLKEIVDRIDSPIDAWMIGIYGMGGIGKTTLAKCIYNHLSNRFLDVSFLPDVRETTRRHGITYLQRQLISDILNEKDAVSRIDDGINIIKSRFRGKKVLILLDDIDDKNQLDALARERDWFMTGSMIIVTTRNKAVLDQSELEVDYKYELDELDDVHALLLFNKHAFRVDPSPTEFEGISRDIISTMGGLPLALQVVGSYLYGKMNRKVWEDVWKQLKSQPHRDVQKILQISYDALEDGHKQIFLDIVCFFIGVDIDDEEGKFAMYMWEGYGFYPSQGIEELKLRCLIKIGADGKIKMHDQLRDLGRSIFCQGQPLEEHSGPWDHDYKGVPRVLRQPRRFFGFLDFLMRTASSDDFNELLSEVRWLKWCLEGSDLDLWPTNLHLPKLAVLDLIGSWMTEDWEGWSSIMASDRLRVLNLGLCDHLRCTPDLSAFTQLKILILRNCDKLEHLHPSIGKLKCLVSLNLCGCYSLEELPKEVGELKDLEELILDYARSITEIPTSIGSLRKLETLSVESCESLREIPSSIGDLQNLRHLDLSFTRIEKLPSAIGRLKNLRTLHLELCRSLEGAIPSEIGDLSSLEVLKITSAPISDLPERVRNLSSLQRLDLWGCDKLRSLPELPSGLTYLSVSSQSLRLLQISSLQHLEELHLLPCHPLKGIPKHSSRPSKLCIEECDKLILLKLNEFNLEEFSIQKCSSIERLDLSQLIRLKSLHVEDCNNLVEIQGLDGAKFLEELNFIGCKSMEALPDLMRCKKLRSLVVQDCKKLTQLRGLEKLDLVYLDISGCHSLEAIPKLSGTHIFRNYERRHF